MTRFTSSASADDPGRADELTRRGLDALGYGHADAAKRLFRMALAFAPSDAKTHAGLLLSHQDDTPERISALWRALAIDPDEPVAAVVGGSLMSAKAPMRAARLLRRQICLRPSYSEAHHRLANALLESDAGAAPSSFDRAIAIEPNSAMARADKAIGLRRQRCHGEASLLSRTALAVDPAIAEAHNSLAMAAIADGAPDRAVIQARRGSAIAPENAEISWNEGLARLTLGDWRRAWPLYEARWRAPRFPAAHRDVARVPLWDGAAKPRSTVLLWAEQGLGDTLQFVRYTRLVRERVGRVVLQVPSGLKRLLADITGVDMCVTREEVLPGFDLHCPLGSLPGLFGTTTETVPDPTPYLAAPADDLAYWADRLADLPRPQLGFCWKGNPRYPEDRMRSPGLEVFRPLIASAPGSAISLVKDLDGDDLRDLPILDLSAEQPEMAVTAAIVANLDLIVTSDTFLPHLAGALGKPVWLLLHHAPDWRWLIGRDDTPWYPSVTLFRQEAPGDWKALVERVSARLQAGL